MSHCVVRLNGTEEVEEFVKAASKCDFDIDIFYNRVIILMQNPFLASSAWI